MAQNQSKKSPEHCPECDVPQLARNHYFTGKLLVERDFTDEQRYFMGKDRRHNRYLHGHGTVCGLKVKEHPQEACRDRFVVIEPGVAIDCCGREIVVRCEELYEFRDAFLDKWRVQQAEAGEEVGEDDVPEGEHDFQICLRYHECPTEEVPSLFDDCGCDDGCEPNRILESFDLDLVLDPDLGVAGPVGKKLDWSSTLHFAGVSAVAYHEASGRLYLLTADAPANLYQLSAGTETVLESRSLPGHVGTGLAVSADGRRIYVLLRPDAGDESRILVLRTDDLAGDPVQDLAFADELVARIAAAPDGRLYATFPHQQQVRVWGTDVNEPGDPAAPAEIDTTGDGDVAQLAISPSGRWAYAASGREIWVLDTADLSVAEVAPVPEGEEFLGLDVATLGDEGDNLAVIYLTSGSTTELRLTGWRPHQTPRVVALGKAVEGLAAEPFSVAYSPSARWVYVSGTSIEDEGFVQVVDAWAVERETGDTVGPALSLDSPGEVALGRDSVYVPFGGDDPDASGVAVIDALGEDCCDLLDRVLDPCPECADGDCVVLATVEDYEWGDRLVDPPDPGEATLAAGPADGEAWIDNRKGRRLLASTQLLTEIVQCLCSRAGEPGEQGLPGEDGEPGEDGPGIDDVDVEFVACDQEGSATLDLPDADPRTLHLVVPSCCHHDLTHICGINWNHGGIHPVVPPVQLPIAVSPPPVEPGLVVAFDQPVRREDIHDMSFRLYARDSSSQNGLWCWCQVPGQIEGVPLELNPVDFGDCTTCEIVRILDFPGEDTFVNGALMLPSLEVLDALGRNVWYRVEVHGDFLRDSQEPARAVDADHLPPWLPLCPSGNCIPGGTFGSWFRVAPAGFDNASVDDLVAAGLSEGLARDVVDYRDRHGPIRELDELTAVRGIGAKTVERLREGLASTAFRIQRGES